MMDKNSFDEAKENMITKIFNTAQIKILINNYALENVILERILPGMTIPFDSYIDELNIRQLTHNFARYAIHGEIIDNNDIIFEKRIEEYYFSFFVNNVERIFDTAPKYTSRYKIGVIKPFKYGLNEYLTDLYPLFKAILQTKIDPDLFETLPDITDDNLAAEYNEKASKFICAIKIKKLRQGNCVDRYVKEIPYKTEFLNKLLKTYKGRYLLANSDTNSIDYKLALLSCFSFYSLDNAKLYELKMRKWEENRNKINTKTAK